MISFNNFLINYLNLVEIRNLSDAKNIFEAISNGANNVIFN